MATKPTATAQAAGIIRGDSGDNFFNVNNPQTRIIEQPGQGNDTVYSTVSYTLPDNVENLSLVGSAAIDGSGNGAANIIVGNNARNRLNGLGGNDTLYGNGGNDILDGGSGADKMYGGTGNDVYHIDHSGDTVTELPGQGLDTVLSSVSYTLPANVENLTLAGNGNTNGYGNSADNILRGNGGNNRLSGLGGGDTVYGGGGNDIINGGDGSDKLYGGAGDDRLIGGSTARLVENDYGVLHYPDSGDGDDYLDGGAGNDTLIGGHGNDTYFFAKGYGHDTIIDYRTPGVETAADPQGTNTVRFGSGIRPEDLEIRANILADGNAENTWHIRIKNSADTLTIHNQNADANPAILRFEFDTGTLYNHELAERIGIQGQTKTLDITGGSHRLSGQDFGVGSANEMPAHHIDILAVNGGRLAHLASDGSVKAWVTSGRFHSSDLGDLAFVPDPGAANAGIRYKFHDAAADSEHPSMADEATHTLAFAPQAQTAAAALQTALAENALEQALANLSDSRPATETPAAAAEYRYASAPAAVPAGNEHNNTPLI